MRRAAGLAAALVLLLTAGARSESPEPEAGEGVIRGRLVHATRPVGAADAEVVLYALTAEGRAGLRRVRSDAEGRFVFEGISTDESTMYLVGARVEGVPFGTRVKFPPGETERDIEIEVYDTSDDAAAVKAGPAQIRLARGCTHLRAWHSHTLHNGSGDVLHVPPEARGKRPPLASIEVAPNAQGFETPIGAQGLDYEDGVVRFWGPLYPGSQEFEFGYGVPAEGEVAALRVAISTGSTQLDVLLPPDHPAPEGLALRPVGPVMFEGLPHSGFAAGPQEPGEALEVRIPITPLTIRALHTSRARLWLELDDAALDVNEIHQLVSADALPVSGSPLLCLPLPADAEELRFSGDARLFGLALDPSGMLAVHGPLPAGESSLGLRYRLAVDGDTFVLERSFATAVDLLEVSLADTGVVPTATRLHPRRPLRSEDRNYLSLEGFAIEPGETVALSLERISPDAGLPRMGAAAIVALAAIAALAFLMGPLRGGTTAAAMPLESGTAMEREAIYRAIDDLDEDLATRKLSAEDHQRMRAELRAQAVELLRTEREAPRAAPRTPDRCPSCDARVRVEDRFCAQCGHNLGPQPAPEDRAA